MDKVAYYKGEIEKLAVNAKQIAARGAFGAIPGAIVGATSNKQDKSRSAVKGALIGGTVSALGLTAAKKLTNKIGEGVLEAIMGGIKKDMKKEDVFKLMKQKKT